METILATAFGRIVEVQKGDSDEVVKAAREIFQSSDERNSVSFAIILPLIGQFILFSKNTYSIAITVRK